MAHVDIPVTLYHGTSITNFCRLLWDALRPSGGVSHHRTKTKSAVFLIDDLACASSYSNHGDIKNPTIVFEYDREDLTGLNFEPDYDDAGWGISAHLDALREEFEQNLDIGDEIDEPTARKIEQFLEGNEGPNYLDLLECEQTGKIYLGANPLVRFPVDDSLRMENPDIYDFDSEIFWDEDGPYITANQFMCEGCVLGIDRVKQVWLSKAALKHLGLSKKHLPPLKETIVTIHGQIKKGSFAELKLYAYSPWTLRKFCEEPADLIPVDSKFQTYLFPL